MTRRERQAVLAQLVAVVDGRRDVALAYTKERGWHLVTLRPGWVAERLA